MSDTIIKVKGCEDNCPFHFETWCCCPDSNGPKEFELYQKKMVNGYHKDCPLKLSKVIVEI